VNSEANLSQAQLTGANSTDRYFDGVLTCSNNRNGFTTSPQLGCGVV